MNYTKKEIAITKDPKTKEFIVIGITQSNQGDTLTQSQTTKRFLTIENSVEFVKEFYKEPLVITNEAN